MHHSAVRVSLNMSLSPLDWRVQPHMTTRASSHARPGILRETSSELLCSVRVEDLNLSMYDAKELVKNPTS